MKRKLMILAVILVMLMQSVILVFAEDYTAENGNIIVDGICYSHDMKKIVSWTELFEGDTFTVPDGVVEIGEMAFAYGCPIKKITIADSVEVIGKDAFYRSWIESVFIGKNSKLSEIGENAFGKCYGLKVIFLPQNIEKIASSAFVECDNLEIINIWQETEEDALSLRPGDINAAHGSVVNGFGVWGITAADARLLLRISAKLENVDAYSVLVGDVNRDGKITSADARLVLRMAAKLS